MVKMTSGTLAKTLVAGLESDYCKMMVLIIVPQCEW